MRQFDVYSIELSGNGSALKVTRPSVIISPDVMNSNLETVIVAPLTLDIQTIPCRVSIELEEQQFEIALDQMRAVERSRLKKKVGRVEEKTSEQIRSILQTMFS